MSDSSYHSLGPTESSTKSEILYQYVTSCTEILHVKKHAFFAIALWSCKHQLSQ